MTVVVSGFPGVGKTHAYKNMSGVHIADSDSSQYSWLEEGVRHPDFPNNYIRHIKSLLGRVDVVFVSSHREVRNALVQARIPFTLVYPQRALKQEYLERFRQRGSDEKFLNLIDANWDIFLDDVQEQGGSCEHFELGRGQYLSDILHSLRYNDHDMTVRVKKRKPKFHEGQRLTVKETTVVAVGNHNALYLTLEPDIHVGKVLSPNVNPLLVRHDEPTALVSFELTGIGPMKTELCLRLGEDGLKSVDAETLSDIIARLPDAD